VSPRRGTAVGEVNLFRFVPRDSPVHHLWPGTKISALIAVGIVVSLRPTWAGELIVLGFLALGMLVARVPLGAVPRFPRWFWIGVFITALGPILSGGSPYLRLGGTSLGLGGFDEWVRLTLLVLVLIGFTALVGWTTKAADLAPAMATLATPARIVRLPVDEMVVVTALAVRCMPLLVDELRTLWAARRVRNPPEPESFRQVVREIQDVLITALVSSTRRAQEMADAIDARGGVGSTVRSAPRWRAAEFATWALTAAVVACVLLV
jgi:energy-coupling factor transporter transmembrane protein EcfT